MRLRTLSNLLLQVYIFTIPLEISKLWFPFLLLEEQTSGRPVSLIDLARISNILLALLLFIVIIVSLKLPFSPRKYVLTPFILFFVFLLSWMITPAPGTAKNEIIRLSFHLLILLSFIWTIRDERDLQRLFTAFRAITFTLGIIVLFQVITGIYLLNDELAISGRYNATMGDPNNLARYMIIGFFAWLFFPQEGTKPAKHQILQLAGMLLCLVGLLFTYSRSGWLIFAGLILALSILSPPAYKKKLLRLAPLGLAAITSAILLSSSLLVRLQSFQYGFAIAGRRTYLLRAGLAMFLDHPVFGVGLGGFPVAYVTDYRDYLSLLGEQGVLLSHTYIVTVAAELGLIGLATVFLFLLQALKLYLDSSRSKYASRGLRANLFVALIAVVTIFLCSQTEGRFWEDPYLWVFWGLLVAGYKIQSVQSVQKAKIREQTSPTLELSNS